MLTLSFSADRTFEPVAVRLREEGDVLFADVAGRVGDVDVDEDALRRQLGRMLGIDADANAWRELGERVPLVGALQREFPGFFTAAKASPWDAATWSIIAPRMNMRQAARLKIEIARELGDAIELDGSTHHVFPAPATLAQLDRFPGLSEEKATRLRGLAAAAQDGALDADRLRSMSEAEALASLQTLRGIGPWAASHIYYRGAAPVDALPTAEPRVLHGLAHLRASPVPTLARFRELAESWRPFRMWVCVLLSRHLARTEGWRHPGLARARAAAGRDLSRRVTRAQA
jgi:DNA-3-methyladenine glycosylase II